MPGLYSANPAIKAASRQSRHLVNQVQSGDAEALSASSSALRNELDHYNQMQDDFFSGNAESEAARYKLQDDFHNFFRHKYVPSFASSAERTRREQEDDWDPISDINVDKESVQRLFDRCKAFLLWRLQGRQGRNQFSKFVTAQTFKTWGRLLLLFVIKHLQQRNASLGPLLSGWSSEHTDGFCDRLNTFIAMVADDKKLPRKLGSRVGYGKKEAALVLFHHLRPRPGALKIHYSHTLQQALALQFCLNFGERTTTFTHVKLEQLKIHRVSDFKWEVEVLFDQFKGNNLADRRQHEERAIGFATSHVQNLQFEVAATLIPLLLFRKALAVVESDGSHGPPLTDPEEFFNEERKKTLMFTGLGADYLFAPGSRGGQAKPLNFAAATKPLDRPLLSSWISNMTKAVGLGGGSGAVRVWRFEKGNVLRIGYGADAAREALHHGFADRSAGVGYHHYSEGSINHAYSSIMMREFASEEQKQTFEAKLKQAGFIEREQRGRAVAALMNTEKREQQRRALAERVDAQLRERLGEDGRYQSLLQEQAESDALVRNTPLNDPAYAERRESLRAITKLASTRCASIRSIVKKREESVYRKQLANAVAAGNADAKEAALDTLEHMDAYDVCNVEIDKATRKTIAYELAAQLTSEGMRLPEAEPTESDDGVEESDVLDTDMDATDRIGDDPNEDGDEEYAQAFGLSANVVISRIAAIQMHFRRLQAADMVRNIAVHCVDTGVCIFCPVGKVGMYAFRPNSVIVGDSTTLESFITHLRNAHPAEAATLSQGVMPNLASTITEEEFEGLEEWVDQVENVPDASQWPDTDFDEAVCAMEECGADLDTLAFTLDCI